MTLTDESVMPFGKFAGAKMKDVEASYLDWLNEQGWVERDFPEVYEYIQKNMDAIDQELEDNETNEK